MGELVFIGLGLHDHQGISLKGIEEARTADNVFIELYTSLMPAFSMRKLANLIGKAPHILDRQDLEEHNGTRVLNAAKKGKTVLLVPGDPLIATTHTALRIEAKKQKIKTRIIHGASIHTAAISLSGLHNYKFGKTVTIPFPDESPLTTPYNTIKQNKKHGLHTLCLLDINTKAKQYLTINTALQALIDIESQKHQETIRPHTLAIGIARAGSRKPKVKADYTKNLLRYNFGKPPHTLIFPAKLHFTETEALLTLAHAPATIKGNTQ